jgi:hypothetical protein
MAPWRSLPDAFGPAVQASVPVPVLVVMSGLSQLTLLLASHRQSSAFAATANDPVPPPELAMPVEGVTV